MEASASINNLVQQISRTMLLNGTAATRLFNSITTANIRAIKSEDSLMSVCSSNELGNSCRICRWNQPGLQIQRCPCECKGSVGYVHIKCLRRWILHKGESRCEICGTMFNLNTENRNYKLMFRTFFQSKYLGAIIKNSAHVVILAPISYLILYQNILQVLLIMDNLQIEEHNTLQIVFLAPALLLTSSIVFFHILEFALTRFLRIKSILRHWWTFGGQPSDPGLDMDVPSDFF
ncbi:E3 ubiquitin-protein ligase MARCHF1 isoform X2 [Eupeodes corollae]|uniref:E3 ubiquitin-protein ligase MARCHF1 isoform X2 n=1 Tax=Eupeodes corollae TaxID=290404 RepID=UPI00248F9DFB|nr:E3 ubiquitin-protein ligase MARCHF1 isoform X2 [Eupeodes corollae]